MIVVYEEDNGKIIYTIEETHKFNKDTLNKGENVIISDEESIRAHTHKIDIKTGDIVKKDKTERKKELQERKEKATNVKNLREQNKRKSQNRIKQIENKIENLERRLLESGK